MWWAEVYQCAVLVVLGLLHALMGHQIYTNFPAFAKTFLNAKAVDDAMASSIARYDALPENAVMYILLCLLSFAAAFLFSPADRTIVCALLSLKSLYNTVDQVHMYTERGQPRLRDLVKDAPSLRTAITINAVNAAMLVTAALAGLSGTK